jgi:hypothetical protein
MVHSSRNCEGVPQGLHARGCSLSDTAALLAVVQGFRTAGITAGKVPSVLHEGFGTAQIVVVNTCVRNHGTIS